MKSLINTIVLPKVISEFERRYLNRMNRIGLAFFALHLPVFVLVAFLNDTDPWLALVLTLAVLVGPTLAYRTFENPRWVSVSYGFTAMLMGGLLVHFGQGPVQIEMHFYFFALLAMLALYGNPMVVLVAAATVALHHLLLWLVLPSSVFNYDAPVWVVAVHAAFVVLESIGTVFIARSFFDNVIGLEKIVQARTEEIDGRNRDLRLVLDNVQQGFMTVALNGTMSPERSRVLDSWLGAGQPGESLGDYLARSAPDTAAMLECGWEQVVEGVLPPELSLDQLPKKMRVRDRHLEISYTPIYTGEELRNVLVVITDVTAEIERERLEAQQREVLHIFDRAMVDKVGFLEFFDESEQQVAAITADTVSCPVTLRRILHTLKGNAAIFRVMSIADTCHAMEDQLAEEGERPTTQQRAELSRRWTTLRSNLRTLLGERVHNRVEIDDEDYEAILQAVMAGRPGNEIARMISDWKLEPTRRRLARVAEQARRIADRLNKSDLHIEINDGNLRLDPSHWAPFWQAFVHVVRNAIDHGIEEGSERRGLGKPERATLALDTRVDREDLVIALSDDGRGIDWTSVERNARERGIDTSTSEALVEALFSDGVTTKRTVSEFSGRGIGLGAVRAACAERGGLVHIDSVDGGGTRIEFRFPRGAIADPVQGAA